MKTTISVIGLGYIGLPTAAMFASKNVNVIGIDINPEIVSTINRGEIHIVEPELDRIVHKTVKSGYLRASLTIEPADVFLIAVPTPFKANYQPDLTYINEACKSIALVLKAGNLVILESTSPVGTTEKVSTWLSKLRPDLTFPSQSSDEIADINIAYCPERVLPGSVVKELISNDRVIGGITQECSNRCVELYKIFVQGECITTNARTAEMAKLTENASRDVNIAFANELSMICDDLNINVWELISLANHHPRVNILQPGPGVGGHCIAVDPWFIISKSPDEAKLIRAAREVNNSKPIWVLNKIKKSIIDFIFTNHEKSLSDVKIAFFGLTFKPNIDDLRESPALNIVTEFLEETLINAMVVEPFIDSLPAVLLNKVMLTSIDYALANCDILILLVDHDQFKNIPYSKVENKVVIDTKGVWF
ncbi:UDP-N-acetyl-D-mannosamine dehydrogenase [Shewanella baltica]|uniref:UDP-N-acetyl-D-mannosamine dehydrogenase n=1 Tax=Shewanella baltica TaxID=62322 RepID=UPI00217E9C8D|nr:UDP-N-acetyl-D-mannosamine dehydrogenase [Shewanella baltica]MCS6238046.1 UDP-N-acetyl-D-mannosamine dehydrogenase [Shewanella baltica]